MAGVFDDKEKQYESKFAHDMELEFKISARASKMLGLWAAEEMHMAENDALNYAMEVVEAGLQLKGDWDVIHKVLHDLGRKGLKHTEKDVQRKMDEFREVADKQIRSEA